MGWSLIALRPGPARQLWLLLPSLAPDDDPGPSDPRPGASVNGRVASRDGPVAVGSGTLPASALHLALGTEKRCLRPPGHILGTPCVHKSTWAPTAQLREWLPVPTSPEAGGAARVQRLTEQRGRGCALKQASISGRGDLEEEPEGSSSGAGSQEKGICPSVRRPLRPAQAPPLRRPPGGSAAPGAEDAGFQNRSRRGLTVLSDDEVKLKPRLGGRGACRQGQKEASPGREKSGPDNLPRLLKPAARGPARQQEKRQEETPALRSEGRPPLAAAREKRAGAGQRGRSRTGRGSHGGEGQAAMHGALLPAEKVHPCFLDTESDWLRSAGFILILASSGHA
uniref:Uncharacterized protein n=1 Tax=Rangifer tarandus platyrhynchus TaxID=3082113 RepID=A0ACB0EXK6_RANTA|nr:unnamed protein product [Rangifer tarandus platyrhynchus]